MPTARPAAAASSNVVLCDEITTSLATIQPPFAPAADAPKDKRFADPDWTANPVFALIRQTYGLLAEQMLATTRQFEGLDPAARAKMEFAAKAMADAMAPTNLALPPYEFLSDTRIRIG